MKPHLKKSHGTRDSAPKKHMLYFIILGVISVAWFLIRVIPKPSRFTYPCQRVAAANAVAFITWLLGTVFAVTLFKKALTKIRQSNFPVAAILVVLALVCGATSIMLTSFKDIKAAVARQNNVIFTPTDLNQPIGIAGGINPGRVTWAYDSEAVNYDPRASNGFWWEDQNTDPGRVDRMFSLSLDGVTGATTSYDSWDNLFRYANIRKGVGDVGYAPGEKIAIKANLLVGLGGGKEKANSPGPTPQLLHSIIEDLIEVMGVPGDFITVYDVSARIPDYIMDPFKNHEGLEYRKVRFVGNPGHLTEDRYMPAVGDLESKIHFADTSVADIFWVKSVTESDYLINLTNMKAHTMAGVTLNAKNLYGSVFIPTATSEFWENGNYLFGFGPNNVTDSAGNPDLHRGLHKCATVHDFEDGNIGFLPAREYGTYNYLVDILGHPQIHEKTILYIVDAFYGSDQQNRIVKFDSFGDDYCSSLFMSQDVIALESVCLDFLRSEPKNTLHVHGNVDNWLHESAQADNPPSGLFYDPGKTEAGLQSLGVHEHWNSWEDKQYTRNLGTGDGIELQKIDLTVGMDERYPALQKAALGPNYPNPFRSVTTISYQLNSETDVAITIYDQLGREIETLVKDRYPLGIYTALWDASDYPDGIYFCRLVTKDGPVKTIEILKAQ